MENVWKVLIAAALAALGAYLRQLAAPLAVLIAVMILDYISGISAAWKTKTLDSRIGLVGIIKKVLIINECISILENTAEMGVPQPPFIQKLLERLKRHTEDIAGEDSISEKNDDGIE